MARKEYVGGVAASTLASGINSAVTSLTVQAGAGADFPTAASFPFPIIVDRGESTEEMMLCTARATDTFTVTRAYDGTTAAAHGENATVEHCIDAGIINALSTLLHTVTTAGDTVYATADATWARLAKGSAGAPFRMNAGATAPEWGSAPTGAAVATEQTTTSTSYTDLATSGPAVTVTTGTKALVTITAEMWENAATGNSQFMDFAVSGASTRSATDDTCLRSTNPANGIGNRMSVTTLVTGLTAGSNTFTAKYRVNGGTGRFFNRNIIVVDAGS